MELMSLYPLTCSYHRPVLLCPGCIQLLSEKQLHKNWDRAAGTGAAAALRMLLLCPTRGVAWLGEEPQPASSREVPASATLLASLVC